MQTLMLVISMTIHQSKLVLTFLSMNRVEGHGNVITVYCKVRNIYINEQVSTLTCVLFLSCFFKELIHLF